MSKINGTPSKSKPPKTFQNASLCRNLPKVAWSMGSQAVLVILIIIY